MEKRYCACGCHQLLVRKAREDAADFGKRRHTNKAHADRMLRARFAQRTCACGRPILRRRFVTTGRLETTNNFKKRKTCDTCKPSKVPLAPYEKTEQALSLPKPKAAPRAPRRPRTASKPAKTRTPGPAPSRPPQAAKPFSGLPDPRRSVWQTVAPAVPLAPCPLHPGESANSCTLCHLPVHHQRRKVGDRTPVWRKAP